MIRIIYDFLFILNGLFPMKISCVNVPIAQVSIFSLYPSPLRIYGDKYNGVPHKVDRN